MAHGVVGPTSAKSAEGRTGVGSRRIFAPHFKLQVLDSYRHDADCKGNQRATARKYGIHRRQIQKWLQAEGALRNSVGRRPEQARPRGDDDVPPEPPAPIDLSLRRPAPAAPPPLCASAAADDARAVPTTTTPCRLAAALPPPAHPGAWDLSIKRRADSPPPSPRPPVKLFKPYLDEEPPKINATQPPVCSNNNNNNVICDLDNNTYLHELPKAHSHYFYTASYHPYGMEYEIIPFYEDPVYLNNNNNISGLTNNNILHCYNNNNNQNGLLPKQMRHSYSLDFKLSAIECYYQDSICKGNQRAVATKYNIHRRQVQKWLKQADELRQKNESVKLTTTTTQGVR